MIVLAVHHQNRNVDRSEIIIEFGFGQNAHAFSKMPVPVRKSFCSCVPRALLSQRSTCEHLR